MSDEQSEPRRGDDFPPSSGRPTGETGTGGITTGPHPDAPPQGEGPASESGGSEIPIEAPPPGPPDDPGA